MPQIITSLTSWYPRDPMKERGSVTMENVIWALAVIAIAAIVVAAITYYVTNHSNHLMGL
ncbi:MAG: hypothetical protein LBG99_04710 [Propionibacteriaceae bacterium]|nr:hypothetical protein [Propionibacteriaceae bacterium]